MSQTQDHIDELRREITMIWEMNTRYVLQKKPNHVAPQAFENRRIRLVEIMRELTALAKKAS